MVEQLEQHGRKPSGVPEQVKNAYVSTVMRCPTDAGDVYLKILPKVFIREASVVEKLREWRMLGLPAYLAIDSKRGWVLMEDMGGCDLAECCTIDLLQRIIQEYAAHLDRESVGYDMLCFINVSIQIHQPDAVTHFREAVQKMPQILECHHVTGEYDYLLKVAIRNRKDLEQFVMDQLTPIQGIARIHTSLVLSEIKTTTALPLD